MVNTWISLMHPISIFRCHLFLSAPLIIICSQTLLWCDLRYWNLKWGITSSSFYNDSPLEDEVERLSDQYLEIFLLSLLEILLYATVLCIYAKRFSFRRIAWRRKEWLRGRLAVLWLAEIFLKRKIFQWTEIKSLKLVLVPRPVSAIRADWGGGLDRQVDRWRQVTSHPKSPWTTGNETALQLYIVLWSRKGPCIK